jgi:hypothetical protein
VVAKPAKPEEKPVRGKLQSTLTSVYLTLPSVEGYAAGGLTIIAYSVEVSSDNLTWSVLTPADYALTYFEHVGQSTGEKLYYRYAVKNYAGWSEFSEATETYVGTEPHQMVAPVVQIKSDEPSLVRFAWSALAAENNGGLQTDEYKVEVHSEGNYFQVCEGISLLECDVPMATLVTEPFKLAQGSLL